MDRGREWARRALAVAVLAALLVPLPAGAAGPSADATLVHPGRGSFVFDGRPAFAGSPIRVYYAAPPDPASADVLVVVHGLNRDGRSYRDDWARVVSGRNVLVLVPEFAASGYPAYNLGDMTDALGAVRPPEQWDFPLVEALFDRVVADVDGDAAGYLLFGFSGGGQFVHRFVELMPRHRARVAVAANTGWYTMPDDAVPFPHGLGGVPVQVAGLEQAFVTNLVVLLGGRDTDPRDPSLQRDPRTDRQGVQRLERGRAFFRQAAAAARARSFTFAWRVHEESALGHVHADAARAALPYLLGDR